VGKKILITPKSFSTYKEKAYPLIMAKGYEIIDNNLGRTMTEQEIINRAKEDVAGIIIGIDPLPAAVLEQCRDLTAISKYGAGMDNIDLKRAQELGIKVKNAAGANSISVAELAITFMFTAARHVPQISLGVKDGGWGRVIGCELTGRRLGLVGGGQIGKEVAKRAVGIGMSVSIYDPYFKDTAFLEQYGATLVTDLDKLFAESDVISLHLPTTQETKKMINSRTLGLMKPTTILINTSRGELVDEEALYTALVNKQLAFAAQDVFSSEPPQKEEKLLTVDNFILTPHIGAYTNEAVERMVMISTQNLLDMLEE
jgi:phosphoglycerate dehydrogenase-like enzyme